MKRISIEVSEEECEILEKRVKEKKEFKTVESYIQNVVKQAIDRLKDEIGEEETYSKEDEEKVKERLRSLGYLD